MVSNKKTKLREICARFNLSFITLFGSKAKGETSFKNDYGIAFNAFRCLAIRKWSDNKKFK